MPVLKEIRVPVGTRDQWEQLELLVNREALVPPVQLDLRVTQVEPVLQVHRVCRALRGHWEILVLLELLVDLGQLGLRERLGLQVNLALLELWVILDQREPLVSQVWPALEVS